TPGGLLRAASRYAPQLELRKLSAARDVVVSVIKPTIWRDSRARVRVDLRSFSPGNVPAAGSARPECTATDIDTPGPHNMMALECRPVRRHISFPASA